MSPIRWRQCSVWKYEIIVPLNERSAGQTWGNCWTIWFGLLTRSLRVLNWRYVVKKSIPPCDHLWQQAPTFNTMVRREPERTFWQLWCCWMLLENACKEFARPSSYTWLITRSLCRQYQWSTSHERNTSPMFQCTAPDVQRRQPSYRRQHWIVSTDWAWTCTAHCALPHLAPGGICL